MQNLEQPDSEIRVLTDLELEAVSGAGILSKIGHFLHDLFSGPGDLRRSTDRPN